MKESEFLLSPSTCAFSQFMYSSSCALSVTKWCGQHPPCFPFSVPASPTGKLPSLSHRASQSLPHTKNQRHSQVGNPSKILDPKAEAQLVPSYGTPASGWGLVSLWLFHLMARKKMYFTHIFTIRWLHLCIQINWTQYIHDTLFSGYREQVASYSFSLFLHSFIPRRG